jgi:hypothetical protein
MPSLALNISPALLTLNTDFISVSVKKQGTTGSFGVNIATQYMSSPLAFKQRVWDADFVPVRGEKFDKLNLIKKGGVLLAVAVISI